MCGGVAVCSWGLRGVCGRIEELGALSVTGYDGYFVCVIEGKVSVDKNKKVRDGF